MWQRLVWADGIQLAQLQKNFLNRIQTSFTACGWPLAISFVGNKETKLCPTFPHLCYAYLLPKFLGSHLPHYTYLLFSKMNPHLHLPKAEHRIGLGPHSASTAKIPNNSNKQFKEVIETSGKKKKKLRDTWENAMLHFLK